MFSLAYKKTLIAPMMYSIPSHFFAFCLLPFAFPLCRISSPPSRKQVRDQSDLPSTKMEPLYPKEISIDSHNHGRLELKLAQQPCDCGGCKEPVFDLQDCYQCLKCDFHLHKECVPSSGLYNLQLIGGDLTFQPDPGRNVIACDACGKNVRGSFYQGVCRGKPRYLHSCCAKLPFKMTDNIIGGELLDLKEKTSLVCLICENQGNSKDFKSWVYVPRSHTHKFCYHVACVKGKVEPWKATEEGGSVQPSSYGAGTSSAGAVAAAGQQGRGIIIKQGSVWGGKAEIFWDAAIQIFNIAVFQLFGLPPLPLFLVIKWLNGTK